MREEKAKIEILCVECEVFKQIKNQPNRALICETARVCGECSIIKKLEDVQKQIDKLKQKLQELLKLVKPTCDYNPSSVKFCLSVKAPERWKSMEKCVDCKLRELLNELLKEEVERK